jgi:outer membrane protein assembly factor BamB
LIHSLRNCLTIIFACGILLCAGITSLAQEKPSQTKITAQLSPDHFWPQWRGPLANGVAPHANPPITWSETNHVRWKLPLPGLGHSTPVIWDNLIFLTSAEPFGEKGDPVYNKAAGAHDNFPVSQSHRFTVLAVDRKNGAIEWKTSLHEAFPHEGGHYTGSLASNSPVTDGQHVFAFFGSYGLYGLNALTGEVIWKKDLGTMQTKHAHGEGSSPVLYGNTLVVNWDHEGNSFLVAFDKRNGKELWKVPRQESTSWSTPLLVNHGQKIQVIVSATKRVRSYDLDTGDLIWECGGLSRNVVATPVAGLGMVFAANSYDRQDMVAINLKGATGDITGSDQVAWTLNRLTPYVPSPVLHGDALYFLRHLQGILSCLDAKTGENRHGPFRLPGLRMVFASPLVAADRMYIVDREGTSVVLDLKPEPVPLSVNSLEDSFSASPVAVGRDLYLRGQSHLYCIRE